MKKILKSIFSFMNNNSYYNTNKESGKTLDYSRMKANRQEKKVLEFFQSNQSEERFSPEDILEKVDFGKPVPITSVRRAMTNLTKAGHLKKTAYMKVGNFGKRVHTWQVNDSV